MIRKSFPFLALGVGLALAACTPPDPGEAARKLKGTELAHCCDNAEFYPPPVMQLADPLMPVLGPVFGNIVFRSGHLEQPEARSAILAKLQPMDLLALSSKNRLSGKTLPGLFGHVVLYLGDEADLKRAGLWDDPAVQPHHAAIRAGQHFIEADTNGVHLSDASHALATDALAVLRLRKGCDEAACDARAAFATLGRSYDFTFDGTDPDKLYCTELAAIGLPGVTMPQRRLYNYDLVLPDDLAALVLARKSELKLVSYFAGSETGWAETGRRGMLADLKGWWREAMAPQPLPPRTDH
ncbi:MAG: YiiX/YebB-like N1pC/P60 family cysteine hydrolase [Paracoccaceae bacterium]|jgi:hypothetical protein